MIHRFAAFLILLLVLDPTFAVYGQVDPPQGAVQTPIQAQIQTVTPVVVVNPPPPKTHLQAIAEQKGALIVCGFTDVGAVQREDGSYVRITAAEFTNTATSTKQSGLLVFIHQADGNARETRSFVDEDEIDGLLTSLDTMSKLDRTTTQLNDYDAKIRTRGDLEIANIDDSGVREVAIHGVEIISSSGQEIWAATHFPLARLAEIVQYVTAGKQMIEKASANK